jgi:heat shock protein HslJ
MARVLRAARGSERMRTAIVARLLVAGILTACLFMLGGCGGEEPEYSLEDTYWVCSLFSDGEELIDVAAGTHLDIVFVGAEVSGSSGCNRFGGAYTLDGNAVTIGPLTSTLMACEEPLMVQEQAYLDAVQRAAEFGIEGSTLTLLDSDGVEVVVFEADMSPLTGEIWRCTGYNDGQQAVVSVAVETTITIEFSENGQANGSSGCNTYEAEYGIDDEGAMEFSRIAVTEMFCASPEGIMEQEEAYLAALETVATYEIRGDELTLRTDEGEAAAAYTRR